MDNRISQVARASVVGVGALLGGLFYFIAHYYQFLQGTDDNLWYLAMIVMAVPPVVMNATVFTSARRSLMQRLAGIVGLVVLLVLFTVVAGWQDNLASFEKWELQSWWLGFGAQLMLIGLLALPWLQWRFESSDEPAFYHAFYRRCWDNGLTMLMVGIAVGLFWLIMLLWAKLFQMINIELFYKVFFETGWFFAVTTGVIASAIVLLARSQEKKVKAVQNLLTLVASGFLPLISLLVLLFLLALPFVGLSTLSHRISAAGLLNCLALISLMLIVVVWHPERAQLRYPAALRYLVSAATVVLPVYGFIAAWALWLRIDQYGWTPERLYGVMVTAITVIWSLGYCASLLFSRQEPLRLQGKVTPAVFLVVLALLILLRTPLLDVTRISVDDQMARYQAGTITADQVSLSLFSQSGEPGRKALIALQKDEKFMADSQRKRELTMLLTPSGQANAAIGKAELKEMIAVAPGMPLPDDGFWKALGADNYSAQGCLVTKDDCLLVAQDLNGDGKPEWILFQFTENNAGVYTRDEQGAWKRVGYSRQWPKGLTKAEVLRALEQKKVVPLKKDWDDMSVFGERLGIDYLTN